MHPIFAIALRSLLKLECTFQQSRQPHSVLQAVPAVKQSQQFFRHRVFLHRHVTSTLTSSSCLINCTLESYYIIVGKQEGEKSCSRAREKCRAERRVLERRTSQPEGVTSYVLLQPGWAEIQSRESRIIIVRLIASLQWKYLVARKTCLFGLGQTQLMGETQQALIRQNICSPFSQIF